MRHKIMIHSMDPKIMLVVNKLFKSHLSYIGIRYFVLNEVNLIGSDSLERQ